MDEDSGDRGLVRALRKGGIDVLTVLDAGMRGRPDPDQLEFASQDGRVLVTANIPDFARLHVRYRREGRVHAGIILVVQQRYGVGEKLRRLTSLATNVTPDDMRGQIQYLNDWGDERAPR